MKELTYTYITPAMIMLIQNEKIHDFKMHRTFMILEIMIMVQLVTNVF